METNAADADVKFLRHALATLAYRAEKVLRDPPPGLAELRIAPSSRTALEIVGHLGDLMEWARDLAGGAATWKANSVGSWEADRERFFRALGELDARLASGAAPAHPPQQIFQAPVADALTHVGQIALLRGAVGAPVRPESFARAEITIGRVGREQSKTRKEFDGDASKRR